MPEKSWLIKIVGVTILLISSACTVTAPVKPLGTDTGKRFVLELNPGEYYRTTTTQMFFFKFPVYPQVAVWVETEKGTYLETIYVTAKAEKNSWLSAPKEGRPEALPVWNHLAKEKTDAVSSATSPNVTLAQSKLGTRLQPGKYLIKLETNRSYDYNETFTVANAGVAGQPSLVYQAALMIGNGPVSAEFIPLGRGSSDGSDGLVTQDLTGINTALKLFSRMTVSYMD